MLLNKRISIVNFIKTIKFDIVFIASYAVAVGILDQYGFCQKFRFQLVLLLFLAPL